MSSRGRFTTSAPSFGHLVSDNAAMRKLFRALRRVAATDATLLLEGETGTGKTALAEVIHEYSPRALKPLITINCGALPASLIESELFGHEKGAFTGAHATQRGAFSAAAGGTILLDEIGELPLAVQPKLLQVLEERTYRRVGGTKSRKVRARVIAATNVDLEGAVKAGRFRADLYHRLNVIRVVVPPLRERPEDIPLLVTYFYRKVVGTDSEPPQPLLDVFSSGNFAGNIRELRNAVERAVLLGEDAGTFTPPPIPTHTPTVAPPPQRVLSEHPHDTSYASDIALPAVQGGPRFPAPVFQPNIPYSAAKEELIAAWEKQYISELLAWSEGNISRGARAAGMNRTHLQRVMQRHGVKVTEGE